MAGGREEQDGWFAALRAAFGPAGDPSSRAALLARLLADLSPAEWEQGRARWRAWLAGQPATDKTATGDAERFAALLPALLSGALDPAQADYAWLQHYLARSAAAQTELVELQQILAEERAARQAPAADAPPPFPAYDLAFLAVPPTPAPPAPDWAAIQVTVKPQETAERGLLLFFTSRSPPAAAPPPLPQVAERPAVYAPQPDHPLAAPGPEELWIPLLAQTLDLGGPPGDPGLVTVAVQAQPGDPGLGCLQVLVSGPGVEGREAAVRLTVEWPGGTPFTVTPDDQGAARLLVPLAALSRLSVTIRLP